MANESSSGNSDSDPSQSSSCGTAIWYPAWHALDQTLVLGLRQRYFFFDALPSRIASLEPSEQPDYVFYNGVDAEEDSQIRFAEVVLIEHPDIGEILRVDTFGLDYILFPANGEEIIIDGEEDPGTVISGWDPIGDWTMRVMLERISDRIEPDNIV